MTKTVKNALRFMGECDDRDMRNEVYEALETLASVGIISREEWKDIYTQYEELTYTTPELIMIHLMGGLSQ